MGIKAEMTMEEQCHTDAIVSWYIADLTVELLQKVTPVVFCPHIKCFSSSRDKFFSQALFLGAFFWSKW